MPKVVLYDFLTIIVIFEANKGRYNKEHLSTNGPSTGNKLTRKILLIIEYYTYNH